MGFLSLPFNLIVDLIIFKVFKLEFGLQEIKFSLLVIF
ncbi:hypothetical protein HNQ62_000442 [Sulfurisphaera ohwakuensis]|uniref:Uncharacterized protein n=1 Tax=Sulfurisphaera ohwakuensis TaxID=69656 RepID=A0A7J9RU06_SULOH|nr:hypothetical protein [Sulfurisphaera ohwakuensis]